MNQLYTEVGVKRKENSTTMMLRTFMIIGIVLGAFMLLLGSYFAIVGVIIVAALVFLMPRLKVEFEYVFVDGQIDFDRIVAGSKRKTALRIDMEQVEIVAQESSHALDSYKQQQFDKRDFTSGDKAKKAFVIIASKDDKRYYVRFEPTEEMLAMIRQKNPRKLVQY